MSTSCRRATGPAGASTRSAARSATASSRAGCRRHEERRRLPSSPPWRAGREHGGPTEGSISLLITGDEEGAAVNGTMKLLDWARRPASASTPASSASRPVRRLGEMAKIGRRGSLDRPAQRAAARRATPPTRIAPTTPHHRLVAVLARLIADAARRTARTLSSPRTSRSPRSTSAIPRQRHPGEARAASISASTTCHTRGEPRRVAAWTDRRRLRRHYDARVTATRRAFLTAPGALTELLARSVEAVTGLRPELNTSGGTSDARFVRRLLPGGRVRPCRRHHAPGRRARGRGRHRGPDPDLRGFLQPSSSAPLDARSRRSALARRRLAVGARRPGGMACSTSLDGFWRSFAAPCWRRRPTRS